MAEEIENCPIVYPTIKEFSNFEEYATKIENLYSKRYGIVKIVPPKQWKARQQDYTKSIENCMIPSPIEQNVFGKGGIYECLHIMKKSISMKDYRKKGLDFDGITDGKSETEVEELFHKNLSFSPPVYGADFMQSLFDPGCLWNLNELPSLLNSGVSQQISGVNKPYLYVGTWKTLFCWHKEDMDLGALNYLHTGRPKYWYAIIKDDQDKLEKMAKSHFADNFAKCGQFLRHKTTIINPYLVKKQYKENIKICKAKQQAGEFILVFPGSYHHGFNYGFNIAEAVNYATVNWFDTFLDSKYCRCTSDQVKISPREFYENLVAKRPELKKDAKVITFRKNLEEREKEMALKQQLQQQKQQLKLMSGKHQKQPISITKKIVKDRSPIKQDAKKVLRKKEQEAKPKQQVRSVSKSPSQENQKILPAQSKRVALNNNKSNTNQELDTWLQCDDCEKWRRIEDGKLVISLQKKKTFNCTVLKGLSCRTREEKVN